MKAELVELKMLQEKGCIEPKGLRAKYKEKNNRSAAQEMAFVRDKVQEYYS